MLKLRKMMALGLPSIPRINKGFGFALAIAIAFLATTVIPEDAFAQRSRSGGSRSRTTTKSRSNTTQKKSTNTNKKATTSKSNTSTKKKASSNPRLSKKQAADKTAAEKALHDKAKKNGTHYKSRADATKAFKDSKGTEIKAANPVKFDSKPATRPSYVPASTSAGGNTYNITYNQSHGGYGYMGVAGTWMMYDIMSDAAFMNAQMRSHGYAYGQPQVYHASAPGFAMIFGIVFGAIFLIVIIAVVAAMIRGA